MVDTFAAVRRARTNVERAQQGLKDAIVDAYHARGDRTVDELADAAGLTRQRIYQLVQEAKDRA